MSNMDGEKLAGNKGKFSWPDMIFGGKKEWPRIINVAIRIALTRIAQHPTRLPPPPPPTPKKIHEPFRRPQEHPEKITCPSCHTDCQLGPGGVAGLLADYGVSGLVDPNLEGAYCTGCKSKESNAVAR